MSDSKIAENGTKVIQEFDSLLYLLRELKPNDRSEQDRYWSITITEVEKAEAVFKTYAMRQGE